MKLKELKTGEKFKFRFDRSEYVKITDTDKDGYCVISHAVPYASPLSCYGGTEINYKGQTK